jgi:predicted metalloprotease with PDZ domain
VSYYTKGALIALCLDLTLRLITVTQDHSDEKIKPFFTLDDVMRKLWVDCKGGLMSEMHLLKAIKDLTQVNLNQKINDWVHSTRELPTLELLKNFGVEAKFEPSQWAQKLGLRIAESSGPNLIVKQVLDGGIAQKAGICEGDEWLAIEVISRKKGGQSQSWRINKLDDIQLYAGEHRFINALISRDKKMTQIKIDLKEMYNNKTLRLIQSDPSRVSKWLTQ